MQNVSLCPLEASSRSVTGTCRQRLEARRQEAQAGQAAVKELTEKERRLEGEVEEASKQVRALREEGDTLRDTESAEAQHVQVHLPD